MGESSEPQIVWAPREPESRCQAWWPSCCSRPTDLPLQDSPASFALDTETPSDRTDTALGGNTARDFPLRRSSCAHLRGHQSWELASFLPAAWNFICKVSNLAGPVHISCHLWGQHCLLNTLSVEADNQKAGVLWLGAVSFSLCEEIHRLTSVSSCLPPSTFHTHIWMNFLIWQAVEVNWSITLGYCPLILVWFCMQS